MKETQQTREKAGEREIERERYSCATKTYNCVDVNAIECARIYEHTNVCELVPI